MSLLLAFLSGGGSTTTLTPITGVNIVSGNAPSLTLLLLIQISPSEGSVIINGQVSSLTLSVAPMEGVVVITGQAPNLTTIIQSIDGSVIITGNVPGLFQTSGQTLSPAEGLLIIQGNAPDMLLTMQCVEGVIEINGYIPFITQNPPTGDTINITGMMANTGTLMVRS